MSNEGKQPTIEALMRLKRLERPPVEFWAQFDSELRAKQLAAIMEKRPWWSSFPRAYATFSRHRLALGTVAGAAVVLFSLAEFRANPGVSPPSPAARPGGETAYTAPAAPAVARRVEAPAAAPVAAPVVQVALSPAPDSRPAASAASANEFGPELASMVVSPASQGAQEVERNDRDAIFSTRSLDSSFAALQAPSPGLVRNLLAVAQEFQAPLAAVREKITEPLTQMTTPAEDRRSRILAEALPMAAGFEVTPATAKESYVSRLSDERIYDSVNQYSSAAADRLSIRF